MEPSSPPPALDGLVVEAVEWLPSGADAGLVRVRGRWADAGPREAALPALGLRRGGEERQFESLPDARFGRDPAVWRGTYLVPAALMADPPPELWLSWESGARSGLAAPERGFEPPGAPEPALAAAPEPDIGGEVIDRAVLAERRARRAEAAEREQARRAADALKALEVLELRSSELERRLEALQAAPPPAPPEPPAPVEVPVLDPAREEALAAAVADVRRLRGELDEQRSRRRKAELLRAADAVALAAAEREQARAAGLEAALEERTVALADAVARAEQAAEQVRLARARAAADAAEVRARAASAEAALGDARAELERLRAAHAEASAAAEERAHDLAAIGAELARVRGELEAVRADAAGRVTELERRLAALDDELVRERRS
ncbi:MAG TPA: hypothetical protein VD836_04730, partial [Solirubrobacteraceae bacterium]|nr:hypothetical protein [Solirubrobacteraceae bacterium]